MRANPRQTGDGSRLAARDVFENDTQYIKVLGRAMDVLGAFRAGDGLLGNSDLADRTGLPTSTVSRITYTLACCGLLQFNRRYRMYELGGEAFAIGRVALANLDVRRLARPRLRELAVRSGFNVGLATRDRSMMIYTDAFEGDALVGLRLFAGSRLPIATSAIGRAYISAMADEDRDELLVEIRPVYEEWASISHGIQKAREEVAERGFCVSLGDWQSDIHGVAAPVRTPSEGKLFAINMGGPAYMMKEEQIWEELGPSIAAAAREIEAMMAMA